MAELTRLVEDDSGADFGLPIPGDVRVDALVPSCGAERMTNGHGEGIWLVLAPSGNLLMSWFDGTILILERVGLDAQPKLSFPCAKAASPTEKAICGSLSLAGFDSSVAEAYRGLVAQLKELEDPDGEKKLREEQKAWLASRNACAGDEACLEKSMQERLESIATFVEREKFE